MTTGVVSIDSDLKRKAWVREGMIQAAATSFWAAYSGNSKESIIYQANNPGAGEGHTVVFDFDGNIKNRAVKGKETAFGKGEQKRKFSDIITVDRYRFVVDNGDEFDAVDIGDLSISQHGDSRKKLGDLWIRAKDQWIFDKAQQAPTHTLDLGTTFDYNTLVDIERAIKTSNKGAISGTYPVRRPLDAFRLDKGMPIWLFIIDSAMASMLKSSSGYQSVVQSADLRGNKNRLLDNIIGKIGSMLIVEAPNFFGTTDDGSTFSLNTSDCEISGLRQYAGASASTTNWTGQSTFDYADAELHSRGLIMGAGAVQLAFGRMPDYRFKSSQDFDIKSESALELWAECQKTNLTAENGDYESAKVAALDYGVIAVDVEVQ